MNEVWEEVVGGHGLKGCVATVILTTGNQKQIRGIHGFVGFTKKQGIDLK